VPATAGIKLAQVGQQSMGRCIEVCGLLRDALSQELYFAVHGRLHSR
jgi:hypothetical protein